MNKEKLQAFMAEYGDDNKDPKQYMLNMIDDYAFLYEEYEDFDSCIESEELKWKELDAKLPVKDFAEAVLIEAKMMKIKKSQKLLQEQYEEAKLNKKELKEKIGKMVDILIN